MKWTIHKRKTNILTTLLANRKLTASKDIDNFLHPPDPTTITPKSLGMKSIPKVLKRIHQAIDKKQPIVIYGDYDADGVCSTAILWETLYQLTPHVTPFIPHRLHHGYGLSIKGIDEIFSSLEHSALSLKPLVITVDNGIVAHQAVDYANSKGIDVIITDHHVPGKTYPKAYAIFHTTKLAGAGVAWLLAKSLLQATSHKPQASLELAAIGSIADMVPLVGANRSLVKHGLEKLAQTIRPGLLALFKDSTLDPTKKLGTYEVNFVLAPRINAMGRIGHALDSLRLLCTKNPAKAASLAKSLGDMNRDRQTLTEDQLLHAKDKIKHNPDKIIIISHETYHEGVIGLVAGKLVETYWRPAIVLSLGNDTAKASARSIPGFNLISALRQISHHLVDVGGHPMAAGFTIETTKIEAFTKDLQVLAETLITPDLLERSLNIDCQIDLDEINWDLYRQLTDFEPFGIGNSRPVFATKQVEVLEARGVGPEKKHLKLTLRQNDSTFPGIGFNLGHHASSLSTGSLINIAYSIDENVWNNHQSLQLKIQDILV